MKHSNKIIYLLLSIFILLNINTSFWYYDKYNSYKNIWDKLIEIPYKEYHDLKYSELYKKTPEYQELNNLVKIDNIFDVAAKDLEKKIALKKMSLIAKIKNNEIVDTWEKDIDNEIASLDTKWRYLVIALPWNLITITDKKFLYLPKYKLLWNVDLVHKVTSIFEKYKWKDGSIHSPNKFKDDLINVFNKYQIKYSEIDWYGIKWDIAIWKNFNKKTHQEKTFFISKWFTTPFLEENYEKNNKGKIYLWKYLTNSDIKYNFNIRDKDKVGSDIIVTFKWLNDSTYLWKVADKDKILSSTILSSKLDLYIYKINKNSYEYIILLLVFIIWWLTWLFLSYNFITNYKNNFKRIPEEL